MLIVFAFGCIYNANMDGVVWWRRKFRMRVDRKVGKSGRKWGRVSFALLSEVTMNRVDYISFSIRKRATFASVALLSHIKPSRT